MYTFSQDYYEALADGSGQRKLFSAGQQIAWQTAYELGLVATPEPPKIRAKAPRPGKAERS